MAFLGIVDVGTFVIAFLILLILPGPGNLALITATARGGIKAGMLATFGVIVGDQIILWLATGGVAALLIRYPQWFHLMQWVGANYLFYMGVMLLRPKLQQTQTLTPTLRMRQGGYIGHALLVTLLNPKALIFYMAFFPQFIDPVHHQGLTTLMVMALLVATITLLYGIVFCALAKQLAAPIRQRPRLILWLERLAGASLVFFAINMLR